MQNDHELGGGSEQDAEPEDNMSEYEKNRYKNIAYNAEAWKEIKEVSLYYRIYPVA